MVIVLSVILAEHVHSPNRWRSSRPILASMLCPIVDTLQSKYHLLVPGNYKNVVHVWQMSLGINTSSDRLERIHLFRLKYCTFSMHKNNFIESNAINWSCDRSQNQSFNFIRKNKVAHRMQHETTSIMKFLHLNVIKCGQRCQWIKVHHITMSIHI